MSAIQMVLILFWSVKKMVQDFSTKHSGRIPQSKLLPAVHRVHFDDFGVVIRQSNPDITEWMDKMGFKKDYSLLEQYYEQK